MQPICKKNDERNKKLETKSEEHKMDANDPLTFSIGMDGV